MTLEFNVLVNLRSGTKGDRVEFYVVPSTVFAKLVRKEGRANSTWYSVYRSDVDSYRDKWTVFGQP